MHRKAELIAYVPAIAIFILGADALAQDRSPVLGDDDDACSSLSYRIYERERWPSAGDADGPIGTSVDLSVHYFISAKDAPCPLSDSTLDEIAEITLHGEAPLDLGGVEIWITPDRTTWIRTDVVERGVWEVGTSITIRERNLDDVRPGYYLVSLDMANSRMPIAECIFNADDDPQSTHSFFEGGLRSGQCGSALPDYVSSKCWDTDWPGPEFVAGAAAGVEFYGCEWDDNRQSWRYMFRLDAVFTGENDAQIGDAYVEDMSLFIDKTPSYLGEGFPGVGAWHLDEDGPDAFDEIAEFICGIAIGAANPIFGFILGAAQLV